MRHDVGYKAGDGPPLWLVLLRDSQRCKMGRWYPGSGRNGGGPRALLLLGFCGFYRFCTRGGGLFLMVRYEIRFRCMGTAWLLSIRIFSVRLVVSLLFSYSRGGYNHSFLRSRIIRVSIFPVNLFTFRIVWVTI
jgi:hypothetical protein